MPTASEIAEYDTEELENQLTETRRELFNLRFQLATGQLDHSTRIGQAKKDVARMLTELRNREIAEAEGMAFEELPAHLAAARRRSEDEALGRDQSTAAERRAAAHDGDAEDADAEDDADVEDEWGDDDHELERADDDGMGEAIGDVIPAEDDEDADADGDEDGSE